jgi:hypothetical protein
MPISLFGNSKRRTWHPAPYRQVPLALNAGCHAALLPRPISPLHDANIGIFVQAFAFNFLFWKVAIAGLNIVKSNAKIRFDF